jgi:hypothetical protein
LTENNIAKIAAHKRWLLKYPSLMAFSLGLFRVLCKMTKLGAGFLKSYLERLEIWKRTIILLDQRNRIPDDQNVCKEKTTSSASTCCKKCRIWICFLSPALDPGVEK